MALRVGVLGPVMAWYGDQELPVGQPRQQAVLGILAMRANRVISRGELVDAVWGQDPPASAEGGIYTYVAGLRRVIEPNRSLRGPGRVLVSSGAGYVLHLVPGQPDAVAFEQDLGRARQLRKAGDGDFDWQDAPGSPLVPVVTGGGPFEIAVAPFPAKMSQTSPSPIKAASGYPSSNIAARLCSSLLSIRVVRSLISALA